NGFTQRLLTSPDGDIAEDEMTTTAGSYAATAPLSSGAWVMQMVAFRTPSSVGADPSIAVNPASVSFGNVALGSKSSQSIILSNTGAGSVSISQMTPTGNGFSISGLALPLTLSSGQSATFNATFSPTTAGSAVGSISVISTASDSPLAVPLSGTGVTQQLSANPGNLSFGNVTIGSSSTLPVVVTNTGSAGITVSQAATTGSGFSVSGPSLPLALATGQNTSFSVTFDPTTAGNVTGDLSIVSNAANSPTVVSLSAMGANKHSVSLSWTASTSQGITGYNVYSGSVSGGPYTKLNTSLVTSTTYTDSAAQAGQTYYYVTTAVDSQGVESADSNQAAAVVPSP
ncbi:MAG TPA: choice-of-anchor D domain-containing protein, partial [Terriglobia bacterium]|nr:choice-of-anchor D domain-containing protein [Terriglobia bacterium]